MDEVTLRLNGYFEDVYAALTARGVPEDRLPTPWAILSHVMDSVDYENLGEWIENFAALESQDDGDPEPDETTELDGSDGESMDTAFDGDTKRKPSYLRALPGCRPVVEPEPESDPETE
jgi:hypothetical protein